MWEETIPDKTAQILHTMSGGQVGACMAIVIHYIEVCYLACERGIPREDVEKAFIDSLRAIA